MNNYNTEGLIIKQSDYKEADRMLTIFTPELGIIQASVRGVRKMKTSRTASAQLFCYSDFELYMGSDIPIVNNVSMKDAFMPISEDICKLSLFTYLADITTAVLNMHNPDNDTLRLFLNSLYASAYKAVPLDKIKPVYELRLMRNCGFLPDISYCSRCGKKGVQEYFSPKDAFICGSCASKKDIKLSEEIFACIYYIVYSHPKKIFAFNTSGNILAKVCGISEKYLLYHADRQFSSLEYYNKISMRSFA